MGAAWISGLESGLDLRVLGGPRVLARWHGVRIFGLGGRAAGFSGRWSLLGCFRSGRLSSAKFVVHAFPNSKFPFLIPFPNSLRARSESLTASSLSHSLHPH